MVDMTFRMEIHFTQTPLDYKSDDLGLQITAGTLQKAVISQNISSQHHQLIGQGLENTQEWQIGPSGGEFISPRHQWTINLMTWTIDYCRNTAKSGHKSKYRLTAPSINWPRA
jgi:hypothetical protein